MRCVEYILALIALIAIFAFPVAAKEIIVAGDLLNIAVVGEPTYTRNVIVDSNGMINLYKAGPLEVAGLSPSEAASAAAGALAQFLASPQVAVTIISAAPRTASINGQVANPGSYAVTSESRLSDLIEMSGGVLASANLERIIINRRYGKEKLLAVKFDPSSVGESNPEIYPGDAVLVPIKPDAGGGSIYVVGEVRIKGPVAFREGITVREALAAAGGPTELADLTKVTIRREGQPERIFDFAKIQGGDPSSNITLEKGDSIYIPALELTGGYRVKGAVNNPGEFVLKGVTTLTQAINAAGGLKDRAIAQKVKIIRTESDKKQEIVFNIDDINAGRTVDPPIQPGDVIDVPSKSGGFSPGKIAGILAGIFFLL